MGLLLRWFKWDLECTRRLSKIVLLAMEWVIFLVREESVRLVKAEKL